MRVTWGRSKDGAVSAGERCPIDRSQHSLAQALLKEGAVSKEALHHALEIRDETGQFLGQILIETSSISEDSLTAFLAKYCRVPHLSLLDYLIDETLVSTIPKAICLKHRILPVDRLGRNLTIAMVNPLNQHALAEVQQHVPEMRVRPVLCAHSHFLKIAERVFGADEVSDEPGPAEARMEDFGFTPFDANDGELITAVAADEILDGETVVTEIMSSFDEDVVEAEPVATSEIDTMLAAMRESMRGTYEVLARRLELFNGLSAEAVATIFASGITVELNPGEALFRAGDASRELYVVLRGSIELRDGETVVALAPSGEIVGEAAWVSDVPRTLTALARETTSLITLSDAVLRKSLSQENAVQLLMNIICILTARRRTGE